MTITTQGIASSPGAVIERFSQALNAGDLEAALTLYTEDAAFAVEPGNIVVGLAAIRAALAGFIALQPTLTGRIGKVIEAGDTALVTNDWSLVGRAPDGSDVHLSGRSADVVRRQPDGSWRVVIDDPWGASM